MKGFFLRTASNSLLKPHYRATENANQVYLSLPLQVGMLYGVRTFIVSKLARPISSLVTRSPPAWGCLASLKVCSANEVVLPLVGSLCRLVIAPVPLGSTENARLDGGISSCVLCPDSAWFLVLSPAQYLLRLLRLSQTTSTTRLPSYAYA